MPCYVRAALFMFNLFDTSVVTEMPSGVGKDGCNDTNKMAMRNQGQTLLLA